MAQVYECDKCGKVVERTGVYMKDVSLTDGTKCHITANVVSMITPEQQKEREKRMLLPPLYPYRLDLCQKCLDEILNAAGFPENTLLKG